MTTIHHKHGGVIETVTAIEHSTDRGVASWGFRGRVKWSDGSVSQDAHIAPFCVCHNDSEGSRRAVTNLMAKLTGYLNANGQWHKNKYTKDGRIYSWTPAKPAGREELPQ